MLVSRAFFAKSKIVTESPRALEAPRASEDLAGSARWLRANPVPAIGLLLRPDSREGLTVSGFVPGAIAWLPETEDRKVTADGH